MTRVSSILPVSVLAVAACSNGGGVPANVPRSSGETAALRARTGIAACTGGRHGRAQCEVLIQNAGFGRATSAGWSPAQLESAYNLPSASKGAGQIVAVVDAYDNPNVASDLAAYRSTFGLPIANFTKYNQRGQRGHYPKGNVGWGVQIDQDVEMVSASCPNCKIYLIEANTSNWSDIESAEAEAVTLGAGIIGNSYAGYGADQSYYNTRGVTYLASAGNAPGTLMDPADFGSVAAVGGTVLSQGGGGSRGWTETVWPNAGGGCSFQPKPPWQHDRKCAYRLGDDVSAVAENVAEYDSYGYGGWFTVGGTTVATGFLAGVFGLAGNATKQDGGRTFWKAAHHKDLYEVQSNSKYIRYSEQTGWGTPDGVGAF